MMAAHVQNMALMPTVSVSGSPMRSFLSLRHPVRTEPVADAVVRSDGALHEAA